MRPTWGSAPGRRANNRFAAAAAATHYHEHTEAGTTTARRATATHSYNGTIHTPGWGLFTATLSEARALTKGNCWRWCGSGRSLLQGHGLLGVTLAAGLELTKRDGRFWLGAAAGNRSAAAAQVAPRSLPYREAG